MPIFGLYRQEKNWGVYPTPPRSGVYFPSQSNLSKAKVISMLALQVCGLKVEVLAELPSCK
jgi:hypothetical protein